jgi:hypothetical protein
MTTLHPRQQPTPQSARIPPDVPSDPGISSLLSAYLRNFALWCRDGFAEQMRNNQALRGLMMLGDNAPAGTNPSVWLLSIGNGGTLHVTPMALGSGDLGTQIVAGSLNFKPLAGVVDGSNAPAGQVGEYLTATGSVALTTSVYASVASIVLTAGDWDVSGRLYVISSVGSSNLQGGFSTTSGGTAQDVVFAGQAVLGNLAQAVPVKRYSVTVSTTVYLIGFCIFASGTASANGYIQARRMR